MGVATGCGFKEIYRFPHITYPYSSCICTFCSSIPTFLFIFKNVFRSCSSTVFLRLNAAAFNRQGYCSAAAFIRGRRLIEGGVY